jgi:RNA-directed DNA polymerase
MRESYGEGLATHTGPESCIVVRKDAGEALTGVRVGRVLSREIITPAVRRVTPGCRRCED